ncbi:MAG: hypothetical protein JWM99_2033 [Verrucomicrobiales bacterium]|nr:hypothetical protein [Verrucomicrobiales bacterium]
MSRDAHGSSPGFLTGRFSCGWCTILIFALLACEHCLAGVPTLEYLFPIAFGRGTKETVTFGGKFDPWPPAVWTDCSGITFAATTNSGKFSVEVSREAPIGPHLLRLYNAEGASTPHIFLIKSLADVPEKEPNDSVQEAQPIDKLPASIGGRLEKGGDVDTFALQLEAGKWFIAKVDAYSLGSPIDPALHLLNENGVRVAFAHDDGPRFDPVLAYNVKKSGRYFLEIAGFVNPPAADIRYAGGPATIYELALTQGPYIKQLFPPGIQKGKIAELQPSGWNLEGSHPVPIDTRSATNEHLFIEITTPESRIPIVITDVNEVIEAEPNNTATNAQKITLPCIVNGRINPQRDEDRFQFNASKGDRIYLQLESGNIGFSLEPLLRIEDSAGQQLAPEDRNNTESKMGWTAPTNGLYIVAVSDLFHRAGDDYGYRLFIGPAKPDFRATVAQDSVRLISGETNELKINVTRVNNYTNALAIAVPGLPEGVTTKPSEVPANNGEVSLSFLASTNSVLTNLPIRVIIHSTNGAEYKAHPATFEIRGKEAAGDRLINDVDQLWLTITPKPPVIPAKAPEKK